jgi:hypothetical protein
MAVIKVRIHAAANTTKAAPTKTTFKVRGIRILGIMLDIPAGFMSSTVDTGFSLWIGTEQVWPTYGEWIQMEDFHAYVPFRYKLDMYDKDATVRAYSTDTTNDHYGEMVIITEDRND